LDELFARDQYEERPLIWKAHLLRQEGQLEAAENVVRQAIAIDPSDGEEGRGDRMRAYSELAEILDARGNKKDADFYREVVKSIRLSETADQFYAAGLLKHAIGLYKEALDHFSDAYCIQSRLAIQMAALGMTAEAEEHYRRAYELMPDSFGRVESHCFGCEKAFDGDKAQGIAEKVFTQLAVERPDKPQIRYLLGYLRQEQDRFGDALTNYQMAVKLDPDYLNAWVKSQEASAQTVLAQKQRDEIILNILRLDPLGRHAHAEYERMGDLAALWDAMATASARQPALTTNLFPLTASKLQIEKKTKADIAEDWRSRLENMRMSRFTQAASDSPAAVLSENPYLKMAGTMILNPGNNLSVY
jgi:tetratricopeptide (TPR) repeat protein